MSYRQSEKETFEKLVREGTSLRRLEVFFQALNLKVKKDAINSHIHSCMNIEASTQREIEKGIKRGSLKSVGRKLGGFFIKPKEEPQIPKACSHEVTEPFFDLCSEKVRVRCRQCGKVLPGSADPDKKQKRRRRDLIIYGSLLMLFICVAEIDWLVCRLELVGSNLFAMCT
ncbi:hypothetical protein GTO27_06755 [Candidatus Bathyarchaeota archaeon]|nr:hypothetical protein [Candidatus Bathyarchaeota archaeon]